VGPGATDKPLSVRSLPSSVGSPLVSQVLVGSSAGAVAVVGQDRAQVPRFPEGRLVRLP
jgi:hypothetical protein